ncbi:MAG: hypothetical protein WKF92_14130 [Pyrinomonadaceae bacterium]
MKRFTSLFSVYAAIGLMVFGLAGQADAQRRSDRETRDIVRSLNSKIDDFQYGLEYQLKSSSADSQSIDDISNDLRDLQDKVNTFDTNLTAKRENRDDVSNILDSARTIDQFLNSNQQNRKLQTDWAGIRTLLERLANSYGVTENWNSGSSNYPNTNRNTNTYPAPSRSTSFSSGLTGTYQLDTAKSENTANIISSSNVGSAQRQDLESKLEAPEQIALDVRGNQVTIASTKSPAITIVADGREKTETSAGRAIRVRATLRGDELTLSSLGGETDYTVTFVVTDSGRTMKVTRRITTEYLAETIFADSIYNKTDAVAGLGIDRNTAGNAPDNGTYSSNDPTDRTGTYGGTPSINTPRIGEFAVPNGTIVTAILENEVNTKASQNNDRFRMTVQSPDEYRGAVIEGYLSGVGRSGKISGSSNLTFNFERITMRDGRAYDFAGSLQGIRDQYGKVVKVDTEGTARGDNQTKETVKRGGIGAGVGAIIGAIAGGGKGAAIGAILGGGAGAGSVIYQGRDDVQLMKGSTITVQSSSPIRRDRTKDN